MHSNFLDSPPELVEIDVALIHDIKIFELFRQKCLLIDILSILLVDLLPQLFVKPIHKNR